MGSMKNWILGATVLAGAAGFGTTTAHAAEFGIHVRGPVAYVPPSPGPGYVWIVGYMADGYRVPGRWNFVGFRDRDRFYRGRGFDRDDRSRDFDRHSDRDHDRFRR